MINIRRNVFETNSSSSHSITIPFPLELEDCNLIVNDEGYIEVALHEFCHTPFDSQMARLAWLVQLIINSDLGHNNFWCVPGLEEWNKRAWELYETEDFKELSAAIAEYANCKGIVLYFGTEGYIDHESCYPGMHSFLSGYDVSIVDFVFGKDINMFFQFCG